MRVSENGLIIHKCHQVRIAEGEHPQDIRESDYFTERGEFRVDSEGSPTLLNCLMYKLSYYRYQELADCSLKVLLKCLFRFGELKMDYRSPAGYDRTRNAVIGHKDFDLTYLDEAYTSEHWLVRIYRWESQSSVSLSRAELCYFLIHVYLPVLSIPHTHVYRVKKPDEFNRPRIEPEDRLIQRKKSHSSKKV